MLFLSNLRLLAGVNFGWQISFRDALEVGKPLPEFGERVQ
jgi:hypothetical protein